jgi:hypothetical protein
MRRLLALAILLSSNLAAQTPPQRAVHGDTLVSPADPAASFVIDHAFAFAGSQVIDILKVAGAEQTFFIDAAPDRSIRRFYWLQFEHYYADNRYTYDYSGIPQQPFTLGRLEFMGDVRVSPGYFTMDQRPGSDSRAAEEFLRERGYRLDGTFVTLRLFHLPDTTRRRELMIIYGEVVPEGAAELPMQAAITTHAQAGLRVR